MNLIHLFYNTFLEALFPLSPAEKALFSYTVDELASKLPPAPTYSGLAVPLPEAYSLFAYKDKRVEQLVWNIKYKKSGRAVEIGGYALFDHLIKKYSDSFSPNTVLLILPIPITKQRRRERGYNQCELLVNEMQRLYKTTCPYIFFENNLLIRTHHDGRHTLKGRTDRVESSKGIFGVNEKVIQQLRNSTVIIVDDVITTGSTMREAIDTMNNAGFKNVRGLSLAH